MVLSTSAASTTTVLFLFLLLCCGGSAEYDFLIECENQTIPKSDADFIEVALNLEYFEAEFFSWGALGAGLDKFRPYLTKGGPSPIGGQKANLSPLINDIIRQFALQEFGHLRAIVRTVKGFPRPLLNISSGSFANVMNNAFEKPLMPPFDPYANDINYLVATYVLPYVGLTGYVGANPSLKSRCAKRLVAGLLGVESGQDATTRMLLYERANEKVYPYNYTVAEFTEKISYLRDRLGNMGLKDEGLIVPPELGSEGESAGNELAGDKYSVAYGRSPAEIFRIIYGTGDESSPGLFYPEGANGRFARSYLRS